MIETLPIRIERNTKSGLAEFDENNIKFGKTFTDHMFLADYTDGVWQDLRILPYGTFSINPAASFLHYGQSIFEGLKAHKGDDGSIYVFRPDANAQRMNASAERMCMAAIDKEIFMEGVKQIVGLDRGWVPTGDDSSLYIRPFMFSTDVFLGVRASENYRFMIIMSPSGPYYGKPVRVKIEDKYVRAAEGGTGMAKAAGNYAASLFPARIAQKQGYDQMVWTDAREHKRIEESGTMNIFFVIDGVLTTPKLSTSILAGVTRDSLLTLAKARGWKVEEREIYVEEIYKGMQSGSVSEAFGAGTAATIAPIATIGFADRDLDFPNYTDDSVFAQLRKELNDYKRGRLGDPYNWLMKI